MTDARPPVEPLSLSDVEFDGHPRTIPSSDDESHTSLFVPSDAVRDNGAKLSRGGRYKRMIASKVVNECTCSVCQLCAAKATKMIDDCASASHLTRAQCCFATICVCLVLSLIIIAAVLVVDVEEDLPSGDNEIPPPAEATMLLVEKTERMSRHPDNVAYMFILEHRQTRDFVVVYFNHANQRIERFNSTTGRLVMGSYNGIFVGNDKVCGTHSTVVGRSFDTALKLGDGSVFLYFSTVEWSVVRRPGERVVDYFSWAPLHDCTSVDQHTIKVVTPETERPDVRDEEAAIQMFMPIWLVSQVSTHSGALRDHHWSEFWAKYLRTLYVPTLQRFIIRDADHRPVEFIEDGGLIAPDCDIEKLVYPDLVQQCKELYRCNNVELHTVTSDFVWDCDCVLQTATFALSHVACFSQDATCFAMHYAWARLWDAVPCQVVGKCTTPSVALPLKVQANGLVVDVSDSIEYPCLERFDGGLLTYQDTL